MKRFDLAGGNRPRLLVSVRNAVETRAALEGGADIIDIKEPRRGSLGKSDDAVIRDITQTVRAVDGACPISAALGELRDWQGVKTLPSLPLQVDYVKLGLSGSADDTNWKAEWGDFRRQLSNESARDLNWVAVIYADWQAARAPAPAQILEAIAEFSFAAVLVDTFHKDGRSLLELISLAELKTLAEEVHRQDLPFAVAGSLRLDDLPKLETFSPGIIAIRTAACRDGQRDGPICPSAVQQFREQIETLVHPA